MSLFGVSERVAVGEAIEIEAEIARLRYRQVALLGDLYLTEVARTNGSRSANEYVASRLDVAPETAAQLVKVAETIRRHPRVGLALETGEITFDRAVELCKQPLDSADPDTSRRWDITGLRRLAHHHRRLTRHRERDAYTHRYLAIQPNLDETQWDLHGRLAGVDGRLVETALHQRGDQLGDLPGSETLSRGQRNADALVAIAHDSLDGGSTAGSGLNSAAQVTVFVDLDRAQNSGAEAGAEIEYGPQIGPRVLEELLCVGSVQVVGLEAGCPVVTSPAARAIPPAVRRFVAWRDGACTADGCTSRYRLQPHHLHPWSHGGSHDPANLTTLCWFHHHVVVHGSGYGIDPDSSPGRIRFTRHPPNRAPP